MPMELLGTATAGVGRREHHGPEPSKASTEKYHSVVVGGTHGQGVAGPVHGARASRFR